MTAVRLPISGCIYKCDGCHGLIVFLCVYRYKCDGCHGLIIGTRVHCDECDDFDLCLCCQNSLRYPVGSVVNGFDIIYISDVVHSSQVQEVALLFHIVTVRLL